MNRLLIIGPPGAGKGTQGKRVAEHLGIPAISTGDIFRANIAAETDLGQQVEAIINSGGYVSDDITNAMVAGRLQESDARDGFLLDGYPRTPGQVEALDEMLREQDSSLDACLELQADIDEVVQRLLDRAQKENRADDTEDVIRQRMAVYAEQTQPLIDIYSSRGLLVPVDGMGTVDEVTHSLLDALKQHQG